jgi:hypothetical protein
LIETREACRERQISLIRFLTRSGVRTYFVGEVSIINAHFRPAKADEVRFRPTPNPNVLIELGYDARDLGWDRIICAFNAAYGDLSDLLFDIRNRRIIAATKATSPARQPSNENN